MSKLKDVQASDAPLNATHVCLLPVETPRNLNLSELSMGAQFDEKLSKKYLVGCVEVLLHRPSRSGRHVDRSGKIDEKRLFCSGASDLTEARWRATLTGVLQPA